MPTDELREGEHGVEIGLDEVTEVLKLGVEGGCARGTGMLGSGLGAVGGRGPS